MAADWRDERIAELEAEAAQKDVELSVRDARVAEVEGQVATLTAQVAALTKQVAELMEDAWPVGQGAGRTQARRSAWSRWLAAHPTATGAGRRGGRPIPVTLRGLRV